MDIDSLRKYCLALPHATENMQWGDNLCLKIGGKLFLVASLDASPVRISFKCSPDNFVELCEREYFRPAPYLARARWVALENLSAVADSELRELLAEAHRLVWEGLPRTKRAALEDPTKPAHSRTAPKRNSKPAAVKKHGRPAVRIKSQ